MCHTQESEPVKGTVEYRSRVLTEANVVTEVDSALGGYAAKAPWHASMNYPYTPRVALLMCRPLFTTGAQSELFEYR